MARDAHQRLISVDFTRPLAGKSQIFLILNSFFPFYVHDRVGFGSLMFWFSVEIIVLHQIE